MLVNFGCNKSNTPLSRRCGCCTDMCITFSSSSFAPLQLPLRTDNTTRCSRWKIGSTTLSLSLFCLSVVYIWGHRAPNVFICHAVDMKKPSFCFPSLCVYLNFYEFCGLHLSTHSQMEICWAIKIRISFFFCLSWLQPTSFCCYSFDI